ncbi:nucleic acid dioxygenase ALKBH1 isoform X1 [Hydra vulgaris]|uniref:nucleic acid dioxygenase ALKBH1 isoform X1 n=1 Tax=Hydra vulgaris TaxID=6087 RepID=UPI00019271E1|nr:nucleic acid dioxygenase ALKBH1 [Hydra vulgaris]
MISESCNKYDRTNDLVFKEYKRYKKRKPPPDFSEVIDFHQAEKYISLIKESYVDSTIPENVFCKVGLKHPKNWKVYELLTCPGFIVIQNPFICYGAQSHWIKQALTEYTKKPYPCNLDALMALDKDKTVWDISQEKSVENNFINQLRWTHMGYHFDYNIVDYKAKEYYGFPKDLAELTVTIADVFKFQNYIAETGIINYYPEGSSMGGHTDHYEEELSQPLISYSFGQAAVFLIGGPTRDIKPEGIWVRTGDIILMTGPSRTAFHAVPCIITKNQKTIPHDIGVSCQLWQTSEYFPAAESAEYCKCIDCSHHLWTNAMNDSSWEKFAEYISKTRININIRQVHKHVDKKK